MRESDKILYDDLSEAGLDALARRAGRGEFNDYFGDHIAPQMMLVAYLRAEPDLAEDVRARLIQNVVDGRYDGTKAESEDWAASPEGREAFAAFLPESFRPRPPASGPAGSPT